MVLSAAAANPHVLSLVPSHSLRHWRVLRERLPAVIPAIQVCLRLGRERERERERERRELVTCWKEARYLALPHPGWDREGDLCWAHVRCPEHAELCRQGRSREILLHQEA
jgi:hypothetical protein